MFIAIYVDMFIISQLMCHFEIFQQNFIWLKWWFFIESFKPIKTGVSYIEPIPFFHTTTWFLYN